VTILGLKGARSTGAEARHNTRHAPANTPQHVARPRTRVGGGGAESRRRRFVSMRRAYHTKPVHRDVATLARSTTATHKSADAPAPAAARPPAPAGGKSSTITEEARWRRHHGNMNGAPRRPRGQQACSTRASSEAIAAVTAGVKGARSAGAGAGHTHAVTPCQPSTISGQAERRHRWRRQEVDSSNHVKC